MKELLNKVTPCGKVLNHDGNISVHKSTGYYRLYYKGKSLYVHRLVALRYLGDPKGLHVNHKDGNKLNNKISNLEYVTRAGNAKHAHATGLIQAGGESNGRAKVTEDLVREIRSREGECTKQLAKEFGISRSNVYAIINRETWKEV